MRVLSRLAETRRKMTDALAKKAYAQQCRRDLEALHAQGRLPQDVVDEMLNADDDYLISERKYLAHLFTD
ncbi:hypothetical protein KDA23_06795 [Candidatus Saccharibacteria bacterium]|nr:hypothetical protein [Candidatus Saccharibacteria bacterium]